MNITVVAETAPAKSLIPVISRLDDNILCLTHSKGAEELLAPYGKVISIGKGRRSGSKKRSPLAIGTLVLKDAHNTYNAMKRENIDLVLTCGNAGDVRKALMASRRLDLPVLHMEQDIYNPIELIAYANLITVPSSSDQKKLKKMYDITNTVNIRGYPQAEYVSMIRPVDPEVIYEKYECDDYYVLFLGGDTRQSDIEEIMAQVQQLDKMVLVVANRFSMKFISQFVVSTKIILIDEFVDLISLMNASSGVIYCAGMGITIEIGVLGVPAIKIIGFHTEHASNDLARKIGISVVSVYDITTVIDHMKRIHAHTIVNNGRKASMKVAELTHELDIFADNKGGFGSLRKIWNQRKKYR
ncbi:MAG: hypothetical protein LUG89_01240 [Methanosphaera sp.]|nr:hypothetical protein [Methanosphaera sp.]